MSNPQIERSNERGRFSDTELRAKVRESKAYQNSPAGKKAKLEAEQRAARCRKIPTKFPGIAKRGTRPALVGMTGGEARTRHAKNILARIEKNTPKI